MGDYTTNQFAQPHGFMGRMAGWLMTFGNNNRQRIDWAVRVMQLQPEDVVMEIGFGPGCAIARMCRSVTKGCIYGMDASQVMVKVAGKRNRHAIRSGKVKLYHAVASIPPTLEKKLDKILSINSFEFWKAKEEALRNMQECMRPGGEIFLVHQVQHKKGEPLIDDITNSYRTFLERAGFIKVKAEQNRTLDILCATGVREHKNQSD